MMVQKKTIFHMVFLAQNIAFQVEQVFAISVPSLCHQDKSSIISDVQEVTLGNLVLVHYNCLSPAAATDVVDEK